MWIGWEAMSVYIIMVEKSSFVKYPLERPRR
jgi:hypothetical protein